MTEKYNSPKPTHEHVELAETTPAVARLLKSGVPRGTIEGAEELQLREKDVGMLQALRFEWRIVLCCLVYLGAALGQGKRYNRALGGRCSTHLPSSLPQDWTTAWGTSPTPCLASSWRSATLTLSPSRSAFPAFGSRFGRR